MAVVDEMESTFENFIAYQLAWGARIPVPCNERLKAELKDQYEAWREDNERLKAAVRREDAKGTMDIASDADRAWFEANPQRKYRLRAPMRGETFAWQGDLTRACAVVVKKIAPGVRARFHCTLTKPLEVFADDEHTAKQLWKEAERNRPQLKELSAAWDAT